MSRFEQIEIKLATLADRLNARITKDRPGYPEVLRTFEERRIDWNDGPLNKAIIIQPNFESTGVNSNIWNFINIAWVDDARSTHRLQWIKYLVEEADFENIEENIDQLIRDSEENLAKIRMEDLT